MKRKWVRYKQCMVDMHQMMKIIERNNSRINYLKEYLKNYIDDSGNAIFKSERLGLLELESKILPIMNEELTVKYQELSNKCHVKEMMIKLGKFYERKGLREKERAERLKCIMH